MDLKKDCIYIGIPVLGKSNDLLRQAIKKVFKQFITNKDVIVYYKPDRRISSFFRLKDKIPVDLKSMIVYEYSCGICHCTYVGQTTRHLRHRISEHAGLSHLTGRPVKHLVHSNIRDHLINCQGGSCSQRDFKILASGRSELELLVKERLLIDTKRPSLNGNAGSFELLLK